MQMGAACCTDALSVEASPSCLQNSPTLIFRVRVREEIMLSCVMRHVVTIKVTERTVQPRAIKNSCKDKNGYSRHPNLDIHGYSRHPNLGTCVHFERLQRGGCCSRRQGSLVLTQ